MSVQDAGPTIGAKLRSLRKAYRLTLEQLAEKTSVTKAHLSLIENDKRSVTVKTLRKILAALNQSLASFFSENEDMERIVYQKDDYISIPEANETYFNKLLAPVHHGRKLEAILTVIQPGGSIGEPYNHRGEEFGLVLEGQGVLYVDGGEHLIAKGDRFYFQSDRMHTIRNRSDGEILKVLFVSTPPTY